MAPELRGQEAETSFGQDCGAQGQRGPEEDSGVREAPSSTPQEGETWQNLPPPHYLHCCEGKDCEARGRERKIRTCHGQSSVPFSGQGARGHTWIRCPEPLGKSGPARAGVGQPQDRGAVTRLSHYCILFPQLHGCPLPPSLPPQSTLPCHWTSPALLPSFPPYCEGRGSACSQAWSQEPVLYP